MNRSRRSFLYGAAAAAGAGLAFPAWAKEKPPPPPGESGIVTGKPRALRYEAVEGFLSKEQIGWHHDSHYGGALKKFVQLDADATGDHRLRTAKMNSVVLHELYFDNMAGKPSDPKSSANAALKKRFGSVDRWIADFRAAALSSRGWAVLAWHPVNGKLYNIATDAHDDGPAWFGVPLVVVDMYEHAYYLDFQNKKKDYVNGFTDHVDWAEVDRRVKATAG